MSQLFDLKGALICSLMVILVVLGVVYGLRYIPQPYNCYRYVNGSYTPPQCNEKGDYFNWSNFTWRKDE